MIIEPGLDAQAFHDQLKDLGPSCVVVPCPDRWPPTPELLAEIRAAAEPQPPTARIEVHPYYLHGIDPILLERSHRGRQELQSYLNEAILQHIRQQSIAAASAMREVYRNVDT